MAKKRIDKFYNFSFNEASNSTDLYIYGQIVSGGNDWKWDETDVTFQDVRDTLEAMEDNSTLNMYINSPGGSVFTTSSMLSMLERAKNRGITINSYIDGLGASCASFLPFVADNLYIYKNSVLMIHRASTAVWGNADDMQQQIDLLNKIENDIIIPMYMSRAKEGVTEQDFRDYMAKESWFTASEIMDIFDNITLLESEKKITACIEGDIMNHFTNMPDNIKELLNVKEEGDLEDNKEPIVDGQEPEVVENEDENKDTQDVSSEEENKEGEVTEGEENKDSDNSEEEGETSKEGEEPEDGEGEESNEGDSNIQDKLEKSNEKVIALNEKVQELTNKLEAMQPIVDEYNAKIEAENQAKKEAKIQETTDLYKNKFEKLGAVDKFESQEVQDLIANSYENKENLSVLNSMIVDLISVEGATKVVKNISEKGKEINDLIPQSKNGLSAYFED